MNQNFDTLPYTGGIFAKRKLVTDGEALPYPFTGAKLGINPIPCKRLLSGLMVTVWWNCMDADSLYIDFNTH